jgi:phenylacetate-CoA oxygenase PaaI subunit
MSNVDAPPERPLPLSALRPEVAAALLALADDELVIGHQHSQWLGLSPFLEEDLTMASIAQDEMGHARALYACLWPDWVDREADVVRRPVHGWRSCQLVELAAPSWEWALIRHWVYDTIEPLRWRALESSSGAEIPGFSALAAKVAQEERFHRHHAEQLVTKLALANPDANARLQFAINAVVPLMGTLLEADQVGEGWELLQVAAERANLVLPAIEVAGSLEAPSAELAGPISASLRVPPVGPFPTGKPDWGSLVSRTVRHPDFGAVHASLMAVILVDPIATW